MDLSLGGKNALVTGSSKGIGLGIAKALLSEGCNVLFNSRGKMDIKSLDVAKKSRVAFAKADVTKSLGIKALQKRVDSFFDDRIDILVCNVGTGRSALPGQEKGPDWSKSFAMNLFSATNTIEGLRSKMRPGGSIICISSICGLEQLGAPLTYSAAKAALNSYVVGLSRVVGKQGVRINAIAPGNILFAGSVWEKKMKENPAQVRAMLEKDVALKKLGAVDDVAHLALFLASEKSSFITGSIYVVDGGQLRSW